MKQVLTAVRWLARTVIVLLVVMAGSPLLARSAPGYLSDAREMDARHSQPVRAELRKESARSESFASMLVSEIRGWVHGDGGISRQYGVPVSELIAPRAKMTGRLVLRSILL